MEAEQLELDLGLPYPPVAPVREVTDPTTPDVEAMAAQAGVSMAEVESVLAVVEWKQAQREWLACFDPVLYVLGAQA